MCYFSKIQQADPKTSPKRPIMGLFNMFLSWSKPTNAVYASVERLWAF